MTTVRDTIVGALTTTAILVVFWLFCRSILPRLPRIVFRGRLRIRRVGLRGVRGLEWSSKGFVSTRTKRKADSREHEEVLNAGEESKESLQSQHHPDSFVLRVSHIYLQFHRRDARHRSWATLHIQGVGIRLPRPPFVQAEQRSSADRRAAQHKNRTSSGAGARQGDLAEREEKRLQRLMLSPPSSPALQNRSTLHQRKSSLFEAVTGSLGSNRASPAAPDVPPASPNLGSSTHAEAHQKRPQLPRRPFSSLIPNTSASSFRTIPLYVGWLVYAYIRDAVVPMIRSWLLRGTRVGLFLLASAIPVVTSLFDVEIHRLEVYVQEAETVFRVGRMGARYSMKVVSAGHADHHGRAQSSPPSTANGQNPPSDSTSHKTDVPIHADGWSSNNRPTGNNQSAAQSLHYPVVIRPSRIPWVQNSITEMLAAMPKRIGSGAKGATAFVMAGVPAAKGNLKLTFESIQVFEALFVTEEPGSASEAGMLRQGSRSAKKTDSFFHIPSTGLHPSLDGHGHPHSPARSPLGRARRQRANHDQSTDGSDNEGHEEHGTPSRVIQQPTFTASDRHRAHIHQRSGSSDAAMGSSLFIRSPLPTSNSGDGGLYSPYQTTTTRWFEAKNSRVGPQPPLAELLASPLPGAFPTSSSMQSLDSDGSDLPHDQSARMRSFNAATPTLMQSMSPVKRNIPTESDFPLSTGEQGGTTAPSAANHDGFANNLLSPPSRSRDGSVANSTANLGGQTLKRSSSTSQLQTMNTLTLSGFTDRWADWALEPIADSTFSSDSGWATSAQGYFGAPGSPARTLSKTIPESARLMFLPGLSIFRVNFVLGPSMQIKQREAVHVGVVLAETNIGIEPVMKVAALVKKRQHEARAFAQSGQEQPGSPIPDKSPSAAAEEECDPLTVHIKGSSAVTKGTKARTALAQLGSLTVALPKIRMSHTLRPLQLVDAFEGGRADFRARTNGTHTASVPSDIQLEAILRHFHFKLQTSDPADPEHQKWLGTCGISNYRRPTGNAAVDVHSKRSSSLGSSFRQSSGMAGSEQHFTPPMDGGKFEAQPSSPHVAGKPLSDEDSVGHSSSAQTKKSLFIPARRNKSTSGGQKTRPPKLVEHRRALQIDASFATFELHCATGTDTGRQSRSADGQQSGARQLPELAEATSDLVIMRTFSMKIRSSWTPYGLLPSLKAITSATTHRQTDENASGGDFSDPSLNAETVIPGSSTTSDAQLILPRPNCPFSFFATDPNEQAVIAELDLGNVSSHVKLRHASALVAFAASLQAAKGSGPHPASTGKQISLPRLSLAFCARDMSFRLDASEDAEVVSQPTVPEFGAHRSLVVAAPSVEFVFHGSYKDAYARRSADGRKDAWKSFLQGHTRFRPDDNEWKQRATTTKTLSIGPSRSKSSAHTQSSIARSKPTPGGIGTVGSISEEVTSKLDNSVQGDQPPHEGVRTSSPEPTLAPEYISGQSSPAQGGPLGGRAKVAYSGSSGHLYNYAIDSNCQIPSVEAYFGFRKERISKSRLSLTVPSGSDLPPFGMSHQHILSLHQITLGVVSMVPAGAVADLGNYILPSLLVDRAATEVQTDVRDVAFDMWHPQALGISRDLIQTFADAEWTSQPGTPSSSNQNIHKTSGPNQSLLDKLPGGIFLFSHMQSVTLNLGGPDKRCEADLARGISVKTKAITIEYAASKDGRFKGHQYGARSAISLPEDIRVNANASAAQGPAAAARLTAIGFEIIPLLDADQAIHTPGPVQGSLHAQSHTDVRVDSVSGHSQEHSHQPGDSKAPALFAPAVWDFQKTKQRLLSRRPWMEPPKQQDADNYLIRTSSFNLSATCYRAGKRHTNPENLKIDCANKGKMLIKVEMLHTYCLLLALSSLLSLKPRQPTQDEGRPGKPLAEPSPAQPSRRPNLAVAFAYELPKVDVFFALAKDTHIFVHVHRLQINLDSKRGLELLWDTLIAAVESARVPVTDLWEEALRLRKWRVLLSPPTDNGPASVDVSGLSASIRIPTDYQFHHVIEHSTVAFKATKQLAHQFLHDSSDTVIYPIEEDPKRVPNISFQLQMLTFEAEDDPIETRLNLIWRAGSSEQPKRMEREATFEEAAAEIRSAERGKSALSLAPSIAANTSSLDSTDAGSVKGARKDESASVTIEEARRRLDMFNGQEWIRRQNNAKREQGRREEQTRDQIFGSRSAHSFKLPVRMAEPSLSAPLLRSIMTRIRIDISRPSFPFEELPDFLHLHGGGMPKDTKYSTVIPMQLRLRLGEWRISLRDYPLPLLHVPPVHPDKGDAYAWDMSGDICLAEQLGGPESIRKVPAVVVPASTGRKNAVPYSIQVPKMVMPLKFYGSPIIDVKTPFPTRIVWGQSVQPAIQDVQRVIESITSPPHDPSPRLPFWDKIPLLLHGHARATFSGDGDVHFFFKGSRDPYEVTGHGAGWVMCWRKGVEFRIGFENDDREFFQVISSECLLAIPDLQDYLDLAASGHGPKEPADDADANHSDNDPTVTGSQKRYMVQPRFQKVCLRLSNGVRFGVGLIYERTCTDDSCKKRPRCRGSPFYRECRIWDRVPHWKVSTKSKQHVEQAPESLRSDSFEGWRSHHIHPSLSIFSPKEGIAGYGPVRKSEEATNSLYFSPLAWEHFWRWVALFGGALSLPVRQGKLFPNTPPQSAKLGAFIATIKYRFMIEPIFISHFYQQASKVNLAKGRTTLVGVKARVDSFRADLHQRQEETIKERPEMKKDTDKKLKVFHKPFNEVELDCAGIDLRTVWARFYDESRQLVDEFEGDAEDDLDDFPETNAAAGEEEWYDIADFAEIDWQPPNGATPDLSITQTMVCPRFHYYRKVESKRERRARQASIDPHFGSYQETHDEDNLSGDTGLTPISELAFSKFGNEHTHTCLVGTSPSSPMVQSQLAEHRLSHLLAELQTVTKARHAATSAPDISAAASMSSSFASHRGGTESPPDAFDARIADLKTKIKLIKDFIHSLGQLSKDSNGSEQATGPAGTQMFVQSSDEDRLDLRALYRDWETFNNRYFVHNPIVYFSTDTRNALLKYYHCSRIRKGFAHHMTAKAVRYVRALRAESTPEPPATQGPSGPAPETPRVDGSTAGETGGLNYIKGLLSEKMSFGMAETPRLDQERRKEASDLLNQKPEPRRGLSDNFTINKSNVAVLLKPQVVLQAKGSIQSSVIITAKRLRLQNYSVLEDCFSEDELNARLMYRNFLAVDGLQAFAPTTHCQYLRTAPHRTMFAYVPLETLVDMGYQTRDFDRIISSTDAVAGYDKFNRLRVNASDKVIVPEQEINNPDFDHLLHHMDFIQVRCPRIALSADSNHFAAIYSVVTDLLLYRDPTSKDHSKRLEEMLFNYDFENLDALCEVLTGLQARVRHAKDLLGQYQENFQFLNKDGKADLYTLNVETLEMITDLDLLMQAITTARDHHAATDNDKKSALSLEASADELGWYMMGLQDGEQLAKLSIKNASFSWLNKADSSAENKLSIGDLQALNIRPDAHYAEIISKYSQAADHDKAKKGLFLEAKWKVLAPVGGIAIIETLDLNLHPVRLSIELKVGREIMDYIFGSKRRQALQGQEARITEVGEEPTAIPANAEHFPKKAKRKGLFGFLSTNKGKESATPSRLAVPSSATNDEREVARSERHRSSPTKRQGRSRSREPREHRPAEERRRSFEDVRSKSRTRRGEREQELGGDSDSEDAGDQDAKQQRDIARRNAESMRRRASTNRTFVKVKFAQTILCLSYKGDKDKSFMDLFDVVFRAPTLEYKNQTCGYEDLVNFCKKDIIRAAWEQRGPLLKGFLHRPRKTSRNVRDFAAQGIGSAVGRLTGQERVASSSRSDSMASKSNDASSSQAIKVPGHDDDDEDDDDENEDRDDESVRFDSERREGVGTSDVSSSFQQRDSMQDDSWSGRSAFTEQDSSSVHTSS
ncbi:unnamed protein product [Tilletia controversa]|nr:hypothetical protein CF328_g432 [Tilletia controversa]CAD6932138.1 unnamed protein product [Tilletia controversa]